MNHASMAPRALLPLLLAASLPLSGCATAAGTAPDADVAVDAPDDQPSVRCPVSPASPLAIAATRPLGRLDQPARVVGRLGSTIETHLGPRWIFAEVGLTPTRGDARTRVNASMAAPVHASPTALQEPLDATDAPEEALVPRSEEMSAPGGDPLALWPTAIGVPQGATTAVFYSRWRLHGGFLNFSPEGVGVARFTADGVPLTREPTLLYGAGERAYLPVARQGDDVYLLSCTVVGQFDAECRMARAASADVARRTSYRYWDGATWTADAGRAAVMARGMNGFSLAYNRHLARWVAVYGEILGNRVFVRTAPAPEGPYGAATLAFEAPRPAVNNIYGVAQNPALSDPEGCSLLVSWYNPLGEASGEMRVTEVTLR